VLHGVGRHGRLVACLLLTGCATVDAAPRGVEVGWRTGYSLPMGEVFAAPNQGRAVPLGDVVTGAAPIWIEAGYRFTRHLVVGGELAYSRALVNPRMGCPIAVVNCRASDVIAGAAVHVHPLSGRQVDPWAGFAVDWEALGVSDQLSGGNYSGVEGAFHLGVNYEPIPTLSIGPFATFAVGPYTGCSSSSGAQCSIYKTGVHEWLTIGLKAATILRIGER
jgi:hypothetical protein